MNKYHSTDVHRNTRTIHGTDNEVANVLMNLNTYISRVVNFALSNKLPAFKFLSMPFVTRNRRVRDDKSLTWLHVVIYFAGRNMLKVRIIGSSITYLYTVIF